VYGVELSYLVARELQRIFSFSIIYSRETVLCSRARRAYTHRAEFLIAAAPVSVISGTHAARYGRSRGSNISARRYFGITGEKCVAFIQPFAG